MNVCNDYFVIPNNKHVFKTILKYCKEKVNEIINLKDANA